jgi:1-pyrroline-5-carboxylate dehydrogenase
MSAAVYGANVPVPQNEPLKSYMPRSPERLALEAAMKEQRSRVHDVPVVIGGRAHRTSDVGQLRVPHDHQHVLARYHRADTALVQQAIDTALEVPAVGLALPM